MQGASLSGRIGAESCLIFRVTAFRFAPLKQAHFRSLADDLESEASGRCSLTLQRDYSVHARREADLPKKESKNPAATASKCSRDYRTVKLTPSFYAAARLL